MNLIYDTNVLKHNVSELDFEGSYRLNNINLVATIVNSGIDPSADILRIHSFSHLKNIITSCKTNSPLAEVELNSGSLDAIFSAVKLSIFASENEDLAMVRPPGHHATRDIAKGFCFFNNIAIASQKLINEGKKVCIIDIDGHHGDGTEDFFLNSDDLFLCSVFQENSYPFFDDHNFSTGSGKGKGYTISIPIPKKSGDDILLASLNFYKTYIDKFNPDIIGISAGFDGYYKDRLLDLEYTLNGYKLFGKRLAKLGYPLFGVLEGGYHNDVLACATALVDGINSNVKLRGKIYYSAKSVFSKFEETLSGLESALE